MLKKILISFVAVSFSYAVAEVELLSITGETMEEPKAVSQKPTLKPDELIMMIDSKAVDCTGVAPMKCMKVKYTFTQPEWEYFYGGIGGFDYEEGSQYLIKVKRSTIENPPADASSIKYDLLEVLTLETEDDE